MDCFAALAMTEETHSVLIDRHEAMQRTLLRRRLQRRFARHDDLDFRAGSRFVSRLIRPPKRW
jgi:hypothetical protein